jgi:metallophosphoesterase (TIGR00282 family)
MGGVLKILFVGDVYGKPGRRAAALLIPKLIEERGVDFCIVNGENSAGGFGITENIGKKFHAYGAQVITTGNHVWDQKEAIVYIQTGDRILRPANFPPEVKGIGCGVFPSRQGVPVGVICMQGRINMLELDCPFRLGDNLVRELQTQTPVIVVDFHAEATSEKIAYGWFMDGRVSAVLGTHTHVQTADEQVLPGGTAYITDVGMTGPHDSVIGAEKGAVLQRFLTRMPVRFEPATGDVKLCGVLIDVDESTGKARHIERLRIDLKEQAGD